MPTDRLERQLAFVRELDQLKQVLRRTRLPGNERRENAAEHSWHAAMVAVALVEHADEAVDLGRVVRMLLVHDVVEIDAGDTFLYDAAAAADQAEREQRAAERIFGLLPPDQGGALRALWEEYESGASPDARYARAVDRLVPILLNFATGGAGWREHGVRAGDVLARNAGIEQGSARLWTYTRELVAEAVAKGYLAS
jgi:putative hydrolases of HD superfamily